MDVGKTKTAILTLDFRESINPVMDFRPKPGLFALKSIVDVGDSKVIGSPNYPVNVFIQAINTFNTMM